MNIGKLMVVTAVIYVLGWLSLTYIFAHFLAKYW